MDIVITSNWHANSKFCIKIIRITFEIIPPYLQPQHT